MGWVCACEEEGEVGCVCVYVCVWEGGCLCTCVCVFRNSSLIIVSLKFWAMHYFLLHACLLILFLPPVPSFIPSFFYIEFHLYFTSTSRIFFSPLLASFSHRLPFLFLTTSPIFSYRLLPHFLPYLSHQYSRNPPAWLIGKSKKQELSLTENGKHSLFWMRILSFNVIYRISQWYKLCLEILYSYFHHMFIQFLFLYAFWYCHTLCFICYIIRFVK